MPFTKAIVQGGKLFLSSWSVTGTIFYLGILFPFLATLTLLAATTTVPLLNVVLPILAIFAFYPFLLVLTAFANIVIYYNAKHQSLARQSQGEYEVKQV
jgi:fatty acid desaturase